MNSALRSIRHAWIHGEDFGLAIAEEAIRRGADEAAVLAWAKANLAGDELASVVKTVESVQVAGLRGLVFPSPDGEKAVAAWGEVAPGCEVRPGSVSFTVSVM